jgi:hypothetical protein
VTFPATLEGSGGTSALAGELQTQEKPNPMAGVEKYMSLDVTWSRNYIQKSLPSDIFNQVGKVITSPPGGAPKVKGRTAWLVNPPSVTKRGKVVEIEESWTLLPEGAPADVYNL